MVAVGLLLASLLNGSEWYYRAVLLALIFASYAVRQRGLRPGELVLVLTMALYFAEGSGVAWGNLAWFLLAAAAGLLSLWLWQFVLLPYDPRRSLRNSVAAFYRRAASLVGAVDAGLETAPAPAQRSNDRERSAAASATSQAQPPRYRGTVPWRAGAGRLDEDADSANSNWPFSTPNKGWRGSSKAPTIRRTLPTSLPRFGRRSNAACVHCRRHWSPAAWKACRRWLRKTLRCKLRCERMRALCTSDGDGCAAPSQAQDGPAPWVAAALRLISGSVQVAQSAGRVRKLAASQQPVDNRPKRRLAPPNRPAPPQVRLFGNLHLHPTTMLGIQASWRPGWPCWWRGCSTWTIPTGSSGPPLR